MAKKKFTKKRIVPLFLLGLGVFLLVQVVMPTIVYSIWAATSLDQNSFLTDPTSSGEGVLGISVKKDGNFPQIFSTNLMADLPYGQFSVEVPSINLPPTKALVNSNDPNLGLAQLPGSALPGERGNVFITGHSALPQFYSPTNFQAIFSNLPGIKKGDGIFVQAAGQEYEYLVEGLKVVDPSDVSVVNPPDEEGRYLTLMTCVPPGLNTKRLIVLAKLKQT